jgi:hypothetical protein
MRASVVLFLQFLLAAATVQAAEQQRSSVSAGDEKVISGMSILGNNDAPTSLYIVPWKSSEVGVETDLTSSLLNEDMVPVDKPVFQRELDFYRLANAE